MSDSSSAQTPTGHVTMVTMQKVDGDPAPSIIHVDSAAIIPDASGKIRVDARLVPALLRCGWGYAMLGGAAS